MRYSLLCSWLCLGEIRIDLGESLYLVEFMATIRELTEVEALTTLFILL
jgi:hypothetical protein